MTIKPAYLLTCLLCLCAFKPQPTFKQFTEKFVKGYAALKIPGMDMSYVNNLKQIEDADHVQKQIEFFESIRSAQKTILTAGLSTTEKQDYELIGYETELNLERLALEKQWNDGKPKEISNNGVYTVPNGKAWYCLLFEELAKRRCYSR